MLRTKNLALALVIGGGLALASPLALADEAAKQKDRVEDRADQTKDHIDEATKAEKKAADTHAEQQKDALDRKADRRKDAVDTQANADKAAIEHKDNANKSGAKEEVTDSWITTKIKVRFVSEKALKGSDISVDTDHSGEVTLSGSVPSKKASLRAFQLASSTKGVRTVNNQVVIAPAK